MRRLASAGITTVLAMPPNGLVRGQSALTNVVAPPDDPLIGRLADYRRGLVVLKAPVAMHISFSPGGAGRGGGYPGALLGTIAFVRQALSDAQWQRDARAYYDKHPEQRRQVMDPSLDALAPVLDRKLPAAFDANLQVEIARALALAKEFNLDPIIVGGSEADKAAADIKNARARVIYSLNYPQPPEEGRGGRGGGRGAPEDEQLRTIRARVNAPKVPAALAQAGVPFAFTSGNMADPARFMRNAARAVREGSLPASAALEALTVGAARIAGVDNRLGTIQKGRIANLLVMDGDWLENATRIRHVFVDGRPVDIDIAAPEPAGRGAGRGRGPQGQ
jgi:imidazolonepropionase-like amidohydrolase